MERVFGNSPARLDPFSFGDELLEKGILKEGQWKFLLAYLEELEKEKPS